MIRVGFEMTFTNTDWMGGVNYRANLLRALAGSKRVQPVIITGTKATPTTLEEFRDVEVIRSPLVDPGSSVHLPRKVAEGLYGRAFLLERLLRSRNIDVLSHSGHMGPRARFPCIGWIPDFQHVRMPEFFSQGERRSRDRGFARLADYCTRVIVSSENACHDFLQFRPTAASKARILHFVSGNPDARAVTGSRESLARRYGIQGPYFHLPNQFWVHKNHIVVIEALRHARAIGRRLVVVCTGNTVDYRHPSHLEYLLRRADEYGCAADFMVLGLVPYADLAGLMRYSQAVINPSYFEGWSTTVEESKSMGKTIILSDIPVHREQAPVYGFFFDPSSGAELADKMIQVADTFNSNVELDQFRRAQLELPQRLRSFSDSFERIAIEAAAANG